MLLDISFVTGYLKDVTQGVLKDIIIYLNKIKDDIMITIFCNRRHVFYLISIVFSKCNLRTDNPIVQLLCFIFPTRYVIVLREKRDYYKMTV